jgi:CRISPR/Cas system CSM-associated protein Csm3 (group 7 of RAMP superfamily)
MTTRLTLFTAKLVQDSALSISGLDRESAADFPFTIVDGKPTLVGRALKGAAVAMARRFFDPLPRVISDDIQHGALRRSAWEFSDAFADADPRLRAGVGILQKTGARAQGVLFDYEVMPAGTCWPITIRVDRFYALNDDEFTEAEGILGYVLQEHWQQGRCWLGGGVSRGMGWCHIEDLQAFRLDEKSYGAWIESGRAELPEPLQDIPKVLPTRSWCFRTLDLEVSFGEYQPETGEAAWGLDMLSIGTHDADRIVQPLGDGDWAMPAWAYNKNNPSTAPAEILTDRAILMDGSRPLLPGSSFRGPLRHAYSRAGRAAGNEIKDPHLCQGNVGEDDPAGKAFGTVQQSSRILIRDARAEQEWAAARLHMHAEDEFSASSYGTSKRDAVRLLKGKFPVRIVIEGPSPEDVESLVNEIDGQLALGALGHLPIGGHKTRGAGWGRWKAGLWIQDDVEKARDWKQPEEPEIDQSKTSASNTGFLEAKGPAEASVRIRHGDFNATLTLGEAAKQAKSAFGNNRLIAWWCDPRIDLALTTPPDVFGYDWPLDSNVQVDEVAFYSNSAVWRAAVTSGGARFVFIEEVSTDEPDTKKVRVAFTPARLHDFKRFEAKTGTGMVMLREWFLDDELLGFTISEVK